LRRVARCSHEDLWVFVIRCLVLVVNMRARMHSFIVGEAKVVIYFAQFLLNLSWSSTVIIVRILQLLPFF